MKRLFLFPLLILSVLGFSEPALAQTNIELNNLKVDGKLTVSNMNAILTVDGNTLTTVAAAVTQAGSVNKTLIILPSTFSGTCPSSNLSSTNPNIVIWDFSGTCNPSTPALSYSGTTYNFTDGNVFSLMRSEFGPSAYGGTNQAIVNGYFQTSPINFNASTGNTVDGISAEVNLFATLTGTLVNAQAAEHDWTVATTGGAVTNIYAGIFYGNSTVGSTTPITNAGGVHAIGCKTMLGVQPTNCYGLLADDQGSIASSKNFSINSRGKVLIGYSGNLPGSSIYFEDSANTPHLTLFVDSSGNMNFQAPTASGNLMEDNLGNVLVRFAGSTTDFRINPPIPFVAGGLDLGKTANPWGSLWLGTAATNNFRFQAAATAAARVINLWDFGANGPSTQNYPGITILTSQYTNSTTAFSNVAGGNTLQFPVLANTTYTAECHLYYQAASTGGLNIEFTGPASPTAVAYGLNLPVSATANAGNGVATAFGSSLGAVVTTAATNFDAIVSFSLINGTNAGTVNLLAKSSAAVQLQIQAGSFCRVQ